jgi:hypothetical protein
MIGRTRRAPRHIMNAVLSSTQASAKLAIVQNSDPDMSVYIANRPSVARQTTNADTNSKTT